MTNHPSSSSPPPTPTGFLANLRFDLPAGFLIFLIAMPLCLGIASASKYPPIVGIWTAVIGGILTIFLSNSQLTIKGPAAGLIVIVEGAVLSLGNEFASEGASAVDKIAIGYRLALGVGVTAGVIQILFGLLKAGKLGELVPLTPVHGMLAAIGITIMAKQFYPMLGIEKTPSGEPVNVIAGMPEGVSGINGTIAAIGLVALAIMIVFPFLKARVKYLKPVPAQLVVLLAAVPLGLFLGLAGMTNDQGHAKFLVYVPKVLQEPSSAFFFPDFRGLTTFTGVKYVILFSLIGSIESMLSSQAIDMLDPWRRKTDQNSDLFAVGVANTLCSAIGALPMISEIVRSKANIDNGARTKFANFFHALFLLAFVLFLPSLICMIPLAALGAMLVYTGFRLASPREFIHAYKIGLEQLVVFVATIAVTLSVDLLVGVCAGIGLKFLIHLANGAPIRSLLRPDIEVAHTEGEELAVLKVRHAAVFSNWLGVKAAILRYGETCKEVQLDLSDTRLVDHTVMEKLHILQSEFAADGKKLSLVGLNDHTPMSSHPLAARKNARQTTTPTAV